MVSDFSAALHLASIVQSSEDAIISKDLDGIIMSWNPAAEQLYGYTADEMIGRPISMLFPQNRPDELSGIMDRVRRGERIKHFETTRIRKDGSTVEVSISLSPVHDERGQIVGVAGIREALASTNAPVVGLSPIVAGHHVRGMAEQLLTALGLEVSASGVALHYGSRGAGGLLDGWLVDTSDAEEVGRVEAAGIACRAVPLLMTDVPAAAAMAAEALALVGR